MALASASSQPKSAFELDPTLMHAFKIAPLSMTAGFRMKVFPRADVVDGAYEGIVKAALPNDYVTPVIELWPELVRKRGIYALAGAEHDFKVGSLSVVPRAQFGVQGYEDKSERLHPNEIMVTVPAKYSFGGGFYAAAKPGYSVLIGPDHYFKDSSFGGRSVAFAMLFVGSEL
jgi:hypothetical protein